MVDTITLKRRGQVARVQDTAPPTAHLQAVQDTVVAVTMATAGQTRAQDMYTARRTLHRPTHPYTIVESLATPWTVKLAIQSQNEDLDLSISI